MEKKEYLVGMTVIECRKLRGKDSSADPFVKISCANLPPQVSKRKVQTNTAVWNQSFTFSPVLMNAYELETFEIIVEVYDYNAVKTNQLIGLHSIGLSTLHRNLNHEFYKVWLTLFNPEMPAENQGFLQVSCYIVGPNERPPSHAMDEDLIEDEEQVDSDLMQKLSEEQRIELMKRKQGIFMLQEPAMLKKGYQLSVNILKAEGLPQCDSSGSCTSFVSVRSVGCVLTTRVVADNFNPIYSSKLCFPINLPIVNDKVTLRIWHQNPKGQDVFIANIPEYPSPYDSFNITKLLSCDGKMKTTWLNLYGVHPLDRGWFQINNQSKKEGTSYLGRVLISIKVLPNEKPQLIATSAQPAKEPQSANYMLWVDTYDIVNCDEANGRQLWVTASIGHQSTHKHYARYKEATQSYSWKKISMKPLLISQPVDPKQTPDLIINVYTEKAFGGEYRLGYVRIPTKDCQRKNANPQWYRLKSPLNDKTCPGIILMNLQYLWEGADVERFPKQRSVEGTYQFFAQILSGFEIAPTLASETLNTKVDIKIGNVVSQKEGITTEACPGRYPVWNCFKMQPIVLDLNLSMASDMRVLVYNCQKTYLLNREKWEVIGEFSVPISSICNLYRKPQFFNVINYEGQLQGQVLARFFLKQTDQKKKRGQDFAQIQEEFNQITQKGFTVNIEIGIFGIRNLIKSAKKPKLKMRLTHDPLKREILVVSDQIINTKNPNFGRVEIFRDVELSVEPLMWPQLEVIMQDEGAVMGVGGSETCYTTISLIEFADEFISQEDLKFAQAQLNKNQNKISLIQKQINPIKYYNKIAKDTLKDNNNEEENRGADNDSDDNQRTESKFGINMAGGLRIKELGVFNANGEPRDSEINQDTYGSNSDDSVDPQDIKFQMEEAGFSPQLHDANSSYASVSQTDGEINGFMGSNKDGDGRKGFLPSALNQEGVFIDANEVIEIACTAQDKKEEEKLRNQMIAELDKQLDKLTLQMQWAQSTKKKEEKREEIIVIKNKINELHDEEMTEDKFWGYVMEEKEDFEYGRDVLREGVYENTLNLPYKEFPFLMNSWYGNKTAQVGGMLRSGVLTGAMLKAAIKVREVESDVSSQDSAVDPEAQPQNQLHGKTPGGPTIQGQNQDSEVPDSLQKLQHTKENLEIITLNKISKQYPFDLTQEKFLRKLMAITYNFKVRVYILTCQNLTAIDSYLDWKSKLAGMQALCSADPFPVIIIGDGRNDSYDQKVKYVNERDKVVQQDLNPKFFRAYEFDASFPEDWKIEIQILDKGRLAYTDALIGSTTIDLEDRLFGNFRRQNLDSLHIYKEMTMKKIQREESQEIPNQRIVKSYKKRIDEIIKEITNLDSIDPKQVPVEFRELRHPNKQQAQGMIEMWTEVLTHEESRKYPMARLKAQSKDEYEIRLVVWECRDVPLADGASVDVYLKVIFDPTGWSGNEVEKKTDIHYNSKDGRGVFNYRFKFSIESPCEFPRLSFQIFDYGMMGDQALGESILNLKKTISMLQKEGKLEIPKTWLSFHHPNKKDEDRGMALISMSILPKAEADSNPVGEAQDEPNASPHLDKPTEGRGNQDVFAANAFEIGKIRIPKMPNFMRNIVIIVVIAIIVIIILVVVMFVLR